MKRDFQALIDRGDNQTKRLGYDLRRMTCKLFEHWANYRDGTLPAPEFPRLRHERRGDRGSRIKPPGEGLSGHKHHGDHPLQSAPRRLRAADPLRKALPDQRQGRGRRDRQGLGTRSSCLVNRSSPVVIMNLGDRGCEGTGERPGIVSTPVGVPEYVRLAARPKNPRVTGGQDAESLAHHSAIGPEAAPGGCRPPDELYEHRAWLWTFVRQEGVEPTNNAGGSFRRASSSG